MLRSTAIVFALLVFGVTVPLDADETRFTVVDSSSSSWVARGFSDYTVSPEDAWSFIVSRNFDNGISFEITGTPLSGTSVDRWFLDFSAPFDAVITPGTYNDFQRWPFQDTDRPGLAFGSTGRLDNRASGFFEVYEAAYDGSGNVLAFSADFTHYGEENVNNWAVVQLRYNSSAVPEPASAAVIGLTGAMFFIRRRRSS